MPPPARRRRNSIATGVSAYECTSINDGARSFPMPDNWVTNVAKDEALAAAEVGYMPKGMVGAGQSGADQYRQPAVLIDCGNGVSALEPTKAAAGRTLQNLAAAGVDTESIDIVLMSQPHPDHTYGIRALDGSMGFRTRKSWCRQRRSLCRETSLRPGDRCRELEDAF